MSAQPAPGGVRWMDMLKNGLGAPLVVLALLLIVVLFKFLLVLLRRFLPGPVAA